MNLDSIAIKVESPEAYSVGNVRALLTEIASQLEKLLAQGETGVIDLKSLPFAPGEYDQLRGLLGRGELSARLEAIGTSEIVETRFPGVWWLTHYNVEGDIVADAIEITFLPEILKSQPEDMRDGLAHLQDLLHSSTQRND
jgi:hydrogenase-1 operon protein HyaF